MSSSQGENSDLCRNCSHSTISNKKTKVVELRWDTVEVEIRRNLQRNAENADRDLYRSNKYDERI